MHRALLSTARLCRHAAAGGLARHGPTLRGTAVARPPRSLAAAAARRYHNISAIATPFPGLQPALPDAAAPSRRWATPAATPLGDRLSALWAAYNRSLARRPLLTKACTSFACVVIGDSIAQAIGGERQPAGAAQRAGWAPSHSCWLSPPDAQPSCPSPMLQARPTASSACCGWPPTAAPWAPPAATTGTGGWRPRFTQRRPRATPRCVLLALPRLPLHRPPAVRRASAHTWPLLVWQLQVVKKTALDQ